MAATSDALGTLHELFASYWLDQMKRKDEDGQPIPLTAAEAAVLRAFLKDNNVQADPAGDADVRGLAEQLRTATSGAVESHELDSILEQFVTATPGLGALQ